MKYLAITATMFSLFVTSAIAQADVLIDNYTVGDVLTRVGVGTEGMTTVDTSSSFLGSMRDETVEVTFQGGGEFFGTIGFSGALDIAQGSSDQIRGSLVYNDFTPIDMTQGGVNDVFELRFVNSDINQDLDGVISVTASDGGGGTSTQFATVPANAGLPQNVYLDFASFTGVNFANVDSVSLNFDFAGNPGRDVEIGLFSATQAIPEPAGTLVIGLVMIGWLQTRRRRS